MLGKYSASYNLVVVLSLVIVMGCEKAQEEKAAAVPAKTEAQAKPADKAPEAGVEKPAAPAEEKKAKAADPVEKASATTEKKEVIFNPTKPPAGYTICHRNHCHKVGGGVASYAQVMKEIGATKIEGVPKRQPMPSAPADVAAPPADAEKTATGLASKVLSQGSGTAQPTATSVVTVHYTGWTTDGKPFDSSVARGTPAKFPLNRVIAGWTEGLQLMKVGEERRFWIPQDLAYKGRPGAPAGMLVFDVELLAIK